MRRGEIWWARIHPPIGERPVVLVSRNEAYGIRKSVTVVPITTKVRGIATEVDVGGPEGVRAGSVANADDIQTVLIRSLVNRVGEVSAEKMGQIEEAIKFALALP